MRERESKRVREKERSGERERERENERQKDRERERANDRKGGRELSFNSATTTQDQIDNTKLQRQHKAPRAESF